MNDAKSYSVQITHDNPDLAELKLSWSTMEFTPHNGMGPMRSLHEAGDSLVAVANMSDDGVTIIGSGVMVAPGLLLTATHVLDEFKKAGISPIFLTFLPNSARAWLPRDTSTVSGKSAFGDDRRTTSDLSLVSCTLNSVALGEFPLMLAPMQVVLPKIGERLWAFGYRHQVIDDKAASVTPLVSSGLVTAAYPQGRGERMPSPCLQVEMDTVGGMSGGPVVNADGYLIGIVSSSFEGGPSFVTLIWDALRYDIKGTTPLLSQREEVNLLYAKNLGLSKIKGNVERRPWGDVVFTMTDEEMKILVESSDPLFIHHQNKSLDRDQLDEFVDTWGCDMEMAAKQVAVDHLGGLSLASMRKYLAVSEVPSECLELILEFSVEDLEGLEDPEVLSTEIQDNSSLGIKYYFNLLTVIWRVKLTEQSYRSNQLAFNKHFVNIEINNGIATMEIMQRCYFKADLTFDQELEEFVEASINWSAVKRSAKR